MTGCQKLRTYLQRWAPARVLLNKLKIGHGIVNHHPKLSTQQQRKFSSYVVGLLIINSFAFSVCIEKNHYRFREYRGDGSSVIVRAFRLEELVNRVSFGSTIIADIHPRIAEA